jgi:hypothetical protein
MSNISEVCPDIPVIVSGIVDDVDVVTDVFFSKEDVMVGDVNVIPEKVL